MKQHELHVMVDKAVQLKKNLKSAFRSMSDEDVDRLVFMAIAKDSYNYSKLEKVNTSINIEHDTPGNS